MCVVCMVASVLCLLACSEGSGAYNPGTPDTVVSSDTSTDAVLPADNLAPPDSCTQQCEGKVCGPNGCGGTCGICEDGSVCVWGECKKGTCEAECEGKECGGDGCGGLCGSCNDGFYCSKGACQEGECQPNCLGKECGDNGCGELCDKCDAGWFCEDGSCVEEACIPDCEGKECGADGCANECGTCESGTECKFGGCVETPCLGDCSDKYCGDDGCGNVCGVCMPDWYCSQFACLQGPCEGICDGKECGDDGCGTMCGGCGAGWYCNDFVCVQQPCQPQCEGKECGDDGCGKNCGNCADGFECVNGSCNELACGALPLEITGAFKNDISDLLFQSVEEVILHKRDVDEWEDGCVASVQLTFKMSGGCVLVVTAGDSVDSAGALQMQSVQFMADSQCPGFSDQQEGYYTNLKALEAGYILPSISKVPGKDVAEACFEAGFEVHMNGVLECPEGGFGEYDCAEAEQGLLVNQTIINVIGEVISAGDFAASCPCALSCTDKVCGDDGCGGSCGECAQCGNGCVDGACLFVACEGKECGDDGCGGSCGNCPEKHKCMPGACVAATQPLSGVTVPDSGLEQCYDDTAEIDCPYPGDDYYGQDGNYDSGGMVFVDKGDGTVKDSKTGLLWTRCASGQTGADCAGYAPPKSIMQAWTYCGDLKLGEKDDWRVPEQYELATLLDYSAMSGALIDHQVFPNTDTNTYWANTPSVMWAVTQYWQIDFGSGWGKSQEPPGGARVRCVQGEKLGTNELTGDGPTAVTDAKTGLTWMRCNAGKSGDSCADGEPEMLSWKDALAWCAGLELAGYSDWRLPAIKEVLSVQDLTTYNPALSSPLAAGWVDGPHWTSTTLARSPEKAVQHSSGAGGTLFDNAKGMSRFLRCVR